MLTLTKCKYLLSHTRTHSCVHACTQVIQSGSWFWIEFVYAWLHKKGHVPSVVETRVQRKEQNTHMSSAPGTASRPFWACGRSKPAEHGAEFTKASTQGLDEGRTDCYATGLMLDFRCIGMPMCSTNRIRHPTQ